MIHWGLASTQQKCFYFWEEIYGVEGFFFPNVKVSSDNPQIWLLTASLTTVSYQSTSINCLLPRRKDANVCVNDDTEDISNTIWKGRQKKVKCEFNRISEQIGAKTHTVECHKLLYFDQLADVRNERTSTSKMCKQGKMQRACLPISAPALPRYTCHKYIRHAIISRGVKLKLVHKDGTIHTGTKMWVFLSLTSKYNYCIREWTTQCL